jgi:hypothetical protein
LEKTRNGRGGETEKTRAEEGGKREKKTGWREIDRRLKREMGKEIEEL